MFKKTLVTLTLVAIALLSLTVAIAYHDSTNGQTQEANSPPVTSPSATNSPSPTAPSASTQPSPSLQQTSPTTDGTFGPLGHIGIVSPSNATYCSNTLTLEISGRVIMGTNVELVANYSLDGQAPLPISIEKQPANPGDPFIAAINGSVALQPLSEGAHYITVFGDLEINNGPHLTQTTVYFTVTSP